MASDLPRETNGLRCAVDDAPRLNPRNRPVALAGRKNISTSPIRKIQAKCLHSLFIQRDGLLFSGFVLCERDMRSDSFSFFVVDIFPAEPQEVADSE